MTHVRTEDDNNDDAAVACLGGRGGRRRGGNKQLTLKKRIVACDKSQKKTGMVEHACRQCHRVKQIAPSRARAHNWICSSCANRQSEQDEARYLARKLTARRCLKSRPPRPVWLARQVLTRCGGKSVLSGDNNVRHLCLVQVDESAEWHADNVVLVTSGEAHALCRAAHPHHRRALLAHTASV